LIVVVALVSPPSPPLLEARGAPAIPTPPPLRVKLEQRPAGLPEKPFHVGLKHTELGSVGKSVFAHLVAAADDNEGVRPGLPAETDTRLPFTERPEHHE
jgi:hypothetical protein